MAWFLAWITVVSLVIGVGSLPFGDQPSRKKRLLRAGILTAVAFALGFLVLGIFGTGEASSGPEAGGRTSSGGPAAASNSTSVARSPVDIGALLDPAPTTDTYILSGESTSRSGYSIAPAGCDVDAVHASAHLSGEASSVSLDLVIDDFTPTGRKVKVEIIVDGLTTTTKYLSTGDGVVRVADLDLTDAQELDLVITADERERIDCNTSPTRLVVDGTFLLAQ